MFRFLVLMALGVAGPARADINVDRLVLTARAAFVQLPSIDVVPNIGAVCGGGAVGPGVYCPSEQRIYLAEQVLGTPQALYVVGHLYGHALQVTYGVADIALAAIRADRAREAELRGMVTRQVECLAGFLLRQSDIPLTKLHDLYDSEPMTGSHWGRTPVREGPQVSIGLAARAEWFEIGQSVTSPVGCSVGEMSAELIELGYEPDP